MIGIKRLIGRRIAIERRKQGLSQERLAEIASLHRTYIGAVERGEKNLTLENIQKIAQALDIKLEYLFRDI